ncbi:murL [Symbiodinium sp. CCMP2592]|nr:murL [Symbiodinium sp. CCMP2592]
MASSYLEGFDLPPFSDEDEEGEDGLQPECAPLPFLRFKTFQVDWPRINFVYTDCDEVEIHSQCFLPDELLRGLDSDAPLKQVEVAVLHIGLVVLAWYWMAFGHQRVVISAGYLNDEQVAWWEWFYAQCFAEFAIVNGFTEEQIRVSVEVDAPQQVDGGCLVHAPERKPIPSSDSGEARVLCLLGGGKDSLVVHQMLQDTGVTSPTWFYVGDGRKEFQGSWRLQTVVERSGSPVLVMAHDFQTEALAKLRRSKRRLQPCGHPWAALVGFDAVLVAILAGFDYIAVGNERSANYGNNLRVGSIEVNHQFDKSFDFESRMHRYIRRHLAPSAYYFSALQHLWEVQIAWLFCQRSADFLDAFMSCNDSNGLNEWCCDCEKCCFVFALLAAWLSPAEIAKYFGKNLLENPKLLQNFRSLLGISSQDSGGRTAVKPFECVGTPDEVLLSLFLAREASNFSPDGLPLALASLPLEGGRECVDLLSQYNPENLLPEWLIPKQGTVESLQDKLAIHGSATLEQKWKSFWSAVMSETLKIRQ